MRPTDINWNEERILLQRFVRDMIADPRPSPWEREFLISVNSQLVARELTEKQKEILRKIKGKYRNAI